MKVFYELMVSLARYELAIAKKYSSNCGYIERLERNVTAREKALSQYTAHPPST